MDPPSRTPRRLPQLRGIRRQPSQSLLGRPGKRRLAPAQWRRDSPRMLARGWRGAGAMLESMLARWWRPCAERVRNQCGTGRDTGLAPSWRMLAASRSDFREAGAELAATRCAPRRHAGACRSRPGWRASAFWRQPAHAWPDAGGCWRDFPHAGARLAPLRRPAPRIPFRRMLVPLLVPCWRIPVRCRSFAGACRRIPVFCWCLLRCFPVSPGVLWHMLA